MRLIALKDKDERFEKKDILILGIFAIIVMAIFAPSLQDFRLGGANTLRIYNASASILDIIVDDGDPGHPPLMFIIYNIYLRFIDDMDAVRLILPTFFFFVTASLSLFYASMKMFGLLPAIMTSIFFLVSTSTFGTPGEYVYGIENMYMFVTFAILSIYLFYKVFVHGCRKMMWLLVASNILMLWSHYAAISILLSQAIFLILFRSPEFMRKENLKYLFVFLLSCIPVLLQHASPRDIAGLAPVSSRLESIVIFFSGLGEGLTFAAIRSSWSASLFSSLIFIGIIYALLLSVKSDRYRLIISPIMSYVIIIISYLLIFPGEFVPPFHVSHLWLFFMLSSATLMLVYKLISRLLTWQSATFTLFVLILLMLLPFSHEVAAEPYFKDTFEESSSDFLLLGLDIIVSDHSPVEHPLFFYLSDTIDDFLRFYE